MNSSPIRRISDTERRTREDRRTPPPDEFREQFKTAEIDPEQQGRWKRLQQQMNEQINEALPPPMGLFSTFEGSTPSAVQPDTQASLYSPAPVTAPAPTFNAVPPTFNLSSSSSQPVKVQPTDQVYVTQPSLDPTADLPSLSSSFWHLENNTRPPTPTTQTQTESTSSSQTSTAEEDDSEALPTKESVGKKQTAPAPFVHEKSPVTKAKSPLAKKDLPNEKKTGATPPVKTSEEGLPSKGNVSTQDLDERALSSSKGSSSLQKKEESQEKTSASKSNKVSSKKPDKESSTKKAPSQKEPIKIEKQEAVSAPDSDKTPLVGAPSPFTQASLTTPSKKEEATQVVALHDFPPLIATAAAAAAQAASSYISPDMRGLFATMVGAIMQKTDANVSRTEILLNTPALKTSTFYGTKIVLEKYSTAPNSYNIALTGGTRAVTLFNANLPSLYQAFQRGNFDFTVGNLRAYYTDEDRPLFKRKGPVGGDKGDQQGQSGGQS